LVSETQDIPLTAIYSNIDPVHGPLSVRMPSVFLAVPSYGPLEPEGTPGRDCPCASAEVVTGYRSSSLLCYGFNELWCAALNGRAEHGYTHFAMNHADVAALPLWCDTLIEEMERVGADVISVVIPIKDDRGETTTGWMDPDSGALYRYTMKEIFDLPETFDAAAAGVPDKILLVNTGLWVCRFTEPWVEEVTFQIRDKNVRKDNGTFEATVISEDWHFSRWLHEHDKRVFATRKVAVEHFGRKGYRNDRVWGTWTHDENFDKQAIYCGAD
jgi:hypothetical protein